ncbi:MAG: MATE family efflux transporter [Spirochaetales bacterium]
MSSDELPAVQNKRALLKRLVVIALPMVVSQASETAMMFVDRLFLAQVSQVHLAAAMAGGLTTFTVASLFVGLVGYVNAIVAQYHGAGKPEYCARATAQAVFVSFLAVPLLVVVAIVIPGFFQVMGHAPRRFRLRPPMHAGSFPARCCSCFEMPLPDSSWASVARES